MIHQAGGEWVDTSHANVGYRGMYWSITRYDSYQARIIIPRFDVFMSATNLFPGLSVRARQLNIVQSSSFFQQEVDGVTQITFILLLMATIGAQNGILLIKHISCTLFLMV